MSLRAKSNKDGFICGALVIKVSIGSDNKREFIIDMKNLSLNIFAVSNGQAGSIYRCTCDASEILSMQNWSFFAYISFFLSFFLKKSFCWTENQSVSG